MNRILGLISLVFLGTTWLMITGCEPDPGPAAEGLPRNEGQGASSLQQRLAEGERDAGAGAQSPADPGQVNPAPPAPPAPPQAEPPAAPGN
jgi:hypothetical protein